MKSIRLQVDEGLLNRVERISQEERLPREKLVETLLKRALLEAGLVRSRPGSPRRYLFPEMEMEEAIAALREAEFRAKLACEASSAYARELAEAFESA